MKRRPNNSASSTAIGTRVSDAMRHSQSYRLPLLSLLVLFISCCLLLLWLYSNLPAIVDSKQRNQLLSIPRSLHEVVQMHKVLQLYIKDHYRLILWLYSLTFLTLQTFAIPGSMFLTVLGGALFGSFTGTLVSSMCTGLGAGGCYLLSKYLCASLVERYLSSRLSWWRAKVKDQYREHLFQYIFLMRLTPIFPGWFLNITAAHIGIPLKTFFYGTVLGIMPTSWIYSQAGTAIETLSLRSEDGHPVIFTPGNIAFIIGCFLLVAMGRSLKRRLLA